MKLEFDNYEVTEDIKDFILGGKADFTIYQEASDHSKERQFKYVVKANENKTCWFVSTELIEGIPVPETLYTVSRNCVYQGYLKRDLSFNIGKKGMENYNKEAVNGSIWVLKNHNKIPSIVHIYHHGKCSICGRKLTDAKSLRCGMGPKCRGSIN